MLLAAVSMGVPSSFSRYFAPQGEIREEALLNIGIAVLLLLAYGLYLLFSLRTHPGVFASVEGAKEPETPAMKTSNGARRVQSSPWLPLP